MDSCDNFNGRFYVPEAIAREDDEFHVLLGKTPYVREGSYCLVFCIELSVVFVREVAQSAREG